MRPLSNAFRRHPTGTALFVTLILYGWSVASTQADDNSSSEIVAAWEFGTKEDVRKDNWPDGWVRRTGPDYPKFIPVAIHHYSRSTDDLIEIDGFRRLASQCYVAWQQHKLPWQVIPEKVPIAIDQFLEQTLLNPYLRVQMDGGAVEISSVLVPIDVHSAYFMTGLIRSDSEEYEASATLRFLDSNRKTLFEMPTKAVTGKTLWKSVSTDSQYPFREDLAWVQVVIQVKPLSSKAYRGEFGFDTLHISRTPRLSLSVDKEYPCYREGEDVIAICHASGMTIEQSTIKLSLYDHTGSEVATANKQLLRLDKQPTRPISVGSVKANAKPKIYWEGGCEWRLQNLAPGYYELTTQLSKGKSGVFELDEQFVVLTKEATRKPDSRFGLTMFSKNSDSPTSSNGSLGELDSQRIIDILRSSHISRVKLPIWYDAQDAKASKTATERIDRLQKSGISCVGVIASPPQRIKSNFNRLVSEDTGAALEDSLTTQTFLEPVMRQMCLRISEFQIGWDHETDFVSNPRLNQTLDSIKSLARRYGQETQIIASRNPLIALSSVGVIDRWQLYSPQPYTANEAEHFSRKDKEGGLQRTNKAPWLNVTPISAGKYSLSARVQDLVSRMVKVGGDAGSQSTTAWVSNPADPEVGILDLDGSPREMFVPFRSMSVAMAGMRHVGSLPVRSLGVNHLIGGGDEARLIVWSSVPITAQLYLGEQVSAKDIWGRPVPVETVNTYFGDEQRFSIDKWPIILEGIDIRVARWRMGIGLEESRIDPLVGQTQELKVRFANPLSNPVRGLLRIISPSILAAESEANFEMEANSSGIVSAPLQVRQEANTSAASIKLGFSIQGEKPVRFVVDQEVQVGTSDFEFDVQYEITNDGQLRLTIEAVNQQPTPLSFDCFLLVPNRPHERAQIVNLTNRVTKLIVLDGANDLIGQTLWLRCEQSFSNRVMNYRIEINP